MLSVYAHVYVNCADMKIIIVIASSTYLITVVNKANDAFAYKCVE